MMTGLVAAEALAFFGPGSAFVTYLLAGCVIGTAVLVVARRGVKNQKLKDLFGITATLLVLVIAAFAMIIFEYQLG